MGFLATDDTTSRSTARLATLLCRFYAMATIIAVLFLIGVR